MELTGFEKDEVIGENVISKFISVKYLSIVKAKIKESFTGKYEILVLHKNGTDIPVELQTKDISIDNELYRVSYVKDLTEKKNAERIITKKKEQFEKILNHIPAIIFLKDSIGNYEFVNSEYERYFSVKNDDIINKTDYDIFPQEFAEKFISDDKRVVEQNQKIEIEEQIPFGDEIHDIYTQKVPLTNQNGEVAGVLGIGFDITERKLIEKKSYLSILGQDIYLFPTPVGDYLSITLRFIIYHTFVAFHSVFKEFEK